MARDLELWSRIRSDFLANGKSYSQLAKEYGVSLSAVKRIAAKEQWTQERSGIDPETLERIRVEKSEPANRTEPNRDEPANREEMIVAPLPTVAEIVEGNKDRLAKFMEITDAMMDRILDAINSPAVVSPYSLKLLASTLRDLREMQGLNKSALDIEEQLARIAKLKSETRIVEESEDSGVIILPAIDETLTPPEGDDG